MKLSILVPVMGKVSGRRAFLLAAVVALCAIGITACTPTLRNHGYAYVNGETPVITPGEDNQTTLVNRLGNPSTRGVFEDNTWYYISATREWAGDFR